MYMYIGPRHHGELPCADPALPRPGQGVLREVLPHRDRQGHVDPGEDPHHERVVLTDGTGAPDPNPKHLVNWCF